MKKKYKFKKEPIDISTSETEDFFSIVKRMQDEDEVFVADKIGDEIRFKLGSQIFYSFKEEWVEEVPDDEFEEWFDHVFGHNSPERLSLIKRPVKICYNSMNERYRPLINECLKLEDSGWRYRTGSEIKAELEKLGEI